MSKETLTKFFKRFELVSLEFLRRGYGILPVQSFITDDLFTELARAGTTLHYRSLFDNEVVAVTDATLDALSSRTIPNKLLLVKLTTGITFARIKKMMEDVLKTGMTNIEYDYGCLKSDQYDAVRGFMFEEFEGWAEGFDQSLNFYRNELSTSEEYTIYSDNNRFRIKFAVDIPDEIRQNPHRVAEESDEDVEESEEEVEESDGEDEESDEESDGEEGPANA